jgi:acyl carrier protein
MMIEDAIRRFIVVDLGWAGSDELTDDYPLLEAGVLDSIGLVHVMTFLEDEFDLDFFDRDVVTRDFASIGSIARFVRNNLPAADEVSTVAGGQYSTTVKEDAE